MIYLLSLVLTAIIAVVVVTLFEFIKVITATILGDDTPKKYGRFTLNPIKHIEPIGLILLIFFSFGWGKPVEIRPGNFKNRKTGTIITYLMPIIFSVLLAEICVLAVKLIGADSSIALILLTLAKISASLAVVNIIPVYPFCGSYILKAYMNPNTAIKYAQNEKILQIIVIFLLFLGLGTQILNGIVNLLIGW